MGQSVSSPIQEKLESLHTHLMTHGGADYDIATTTTLTYDLFLSYITRLNEICRDFKDGSGNVLVFAVKKGSDTTFFWKTTVRVACVKWNTRKNKVESHRLLNIRQFLQVFRRISYECTGGHLGIAATPEQDASSSLLSNEDGIQSTPPTLAASIVLKECKGLKGGDFTDEDPTGLKECVICLERKPDVILPCCHSYCLPCIEQWWEYCEDDSTAYCTLARFAHEDMNVKDKSCPVCRESLSSTDDTWVISEAPDGLEVTAEIQRSLMGIASSAGATGGSKRHRTP